MKVCIPTFLPGGLLARVSKVELAESYTIITIHPGGSLGVEVMSPDKRFLPAMLMASGVSILLAPEAPREPNGFWQCGIRIFIGQSEMANDLLAEYRNGFTAEL